MYEEQTYEQESRHFEVHDGVEVAAPVLLKCEKGNRYGSVEGLSDEELADPDELQRQIGREQWGGILMLPQPKCRQFNPGWDWSTDVDFDAFGRKEVVHHLIQMGLCFGVAGPKGQGGFQISPGFFQLAILLAQDASLTVSCGQKRLDFLISR